MATRGAAAVAGTGVALGLTAKAGIDAVSSYMRKKTDEKNAKLMRGMRGEKEPPKKKSVMDNFKESGAIVKDAFTSKKTKPKAHTNAEVSAARSRYDRENK